MVGGPPSLHERKTHCALAGRIAARGRPECARCSNPIPESRAPDRGAVRQQLETHRGGEQLDRRALPRTAGTRWRPRSERRCRSARRLRPCPIRQIQSRDWALLQRDRRPGRQPHIRTLLVGNLVHPDRSRGGAGRRRHWKKTRETAYSVVRSAWYHGIPGSAVIVTMLEARPTVQPGCSSVGKRSGPWA